MYQLSFIVCPTCDGKKTFDLHVYLHMFNLLSSITYVNLGLNEFFAEKKIAKKLTIYENVI